MTEAQAAQIVTLLTAILGQLEYMNAVIDVDCGMESLMTMPAEGAA